MSWNLFIHYHLAFPEHLRHVKLPSLYMEVSHKCGFRPPTLRSQGSLERAMYININKCLLITQEKAVLKLRESMEARPLPPPLLGEGVRQPLELVRKQEHSLVQQRS